MAMLSGEEFKVVVEPDKAILSIKIKIGFARAMPYHRLQLLLGSDVLVDSHKISDYNIQHGSKLTLVVLAPPT